MLTVYAFTASITKFCVLYFVKGNIAALLPPCMSALPSNQLSKSTHGSQKCTTQRRGRKGERGEAEGRNLKMMCGR